MSVPQRFARRLNQEWLLKFLGVRIGDKRVLRLIWRILKSGVMENGLVAASEEGTPQGGSLEDPWPGSCQSGSVYDPITCVPRIREE